LNYVSCSDIGSRGKAVHLLSAALTSKKRKRAERTNRVLDLPVKLAIQRPKKTLSVIPKANNIPKSGLVAQQTE
jgi:isocitrate/isopropylmalate dehydrogenase